MHQRKHSDSLTSPISDSDAGAFLTMQGAAPFGSHPRREAVSRHFASKKRTRKGASGGDSQRAHSKNPWKRLDILCNLWYS